MSNYSGEASAYANKVASFKMSVTQISEELSSIEGKLSGTGDTTLKENLQSKINQIKEQLDSIVNEASSNVSKLQTKARELDEEELMAALKRKQEEQENQDNPVDNNDDNVGGV